MDGPANDENATAQPARKRRRWPWVLAAVLVATPLLLRAALPTLVERGAAYASRQWLGLPIRIDNADFDLRSGLVVLEGIAVGAEADATSPWDAAKSPPAIDPAAALLHVGRVTARLSWGELPDNVLRLSEFSVEAPAVRVAREADGAIDPMRHARPVARAAGEEDAQDDEEEEATEPWVVAVDRFTLGEPDVVVVDPASGENLLQFSLENFALEAVRVDGGDLSLGGVGIEGPVLRVRRDLVLASPKAPAPPAAVVAEESADGATSLAVPGANDAASAAPAVAPAPPAVPVSPAEAAPTPAPTPPAAPAQPAAAAPPSQPAPGLRIEKIDIARATFTWVTDKGPLDVALVLKASDVSADEGHRFPVDLALEIEDGRVALVGDVGVLPPSYTGRFSWEGLPFPPLLLASLPELAAWLRSADSSGELALDVDVAGARGEPSLKMSGRAAVETLEIADPGDKEVALGWKRFEVQMAEVFVPLPSKDAPARTTRARLDLVRLVEPRIRYTHPSPALQAVLGIKAASGPQAGPGNDGAPQADQATAPDDSAKAKPDANSGKGAADAKDGPSEGSEVVVGERDPAPAASAAAPVEVAVAFVELVGGDVEVVDTSVAPPVTSFVRHLEASARDVRWPGPSASTIRLTAELPVSSRLAVDGDLRGPGDGDFKLKLDTLDLPLFSPYAMLGGAALEQGTVSLETRVKMRGGVIQADNALLLSQFGVTLRDPTTFESSFGMPIDLALALLRDPRGDIRLAIPVKVDEKGASVSVGAVIASALKAALLGAVTAPLKMLGAVFSPGGGAGGLSIEPVAAVAGRAEGGPEAPGRARALATLLGDRPGMGLELRGRTGEADAPVVAEQILIEKVSKKEDLPEIDGSGFLARRRVREALAAAAKTGATGRAPEALSAEDRTLYERYIAAVEVPAARYDELAAARAAALRDLVADAGGDPARLKVGPRDSSSGSPATVLSFYRP